MLQHRSEGWGAEHAILAVPLQGCAGKTTATSGASVTGGKRLCYLGNDKLLFSALIAGSSSVPPEKGSKHLSLKPKLQLSLALALPCNGCWLRGLRGNRCFKKGPPFPNVWKHWPWTPNGIFVSGCLWQIQPHLMVESIWSRREIFCPVEDGHSLVSLMADFNNFMLVYIKWNLGSGKPLHIQNQLMLALTFSSKKGWSELLLHGPSRTHTVPAP